MVMIDEQKIIEQIFSYVKQKLIQTGDGHDWEHTYRVYMYSNQIAEKEVNVNHFVLKISALLHDVADHKLGYNEVEQKKRIEDVLKQFCVNEDNLIKITKIVQSISYMDGKNKCICDDIESKIIKDADRLEAIGAIGIARTFAYGGHVERAIFSQEDTDTISHFYNKLLLLKEGMHTTLGTKLALERHEFMILYLKQFYSEWFGKEEGEIYFNKRRTL